MTGMASTSPKAEAQTLLGGIHLTQRCKNCKNISYCTHPFDGTQTMEFSTE